MADYTGKDHMASVLNGKRTDRIPARGMVSLREGLKRTGITGREINTRPDKYKGSIAVAAAPNAYRYILCSGCQIPDNAPVEHVQHLLECGRRYGHYDQIATLSAPH